MQAYTTEKGITTRWHDNLPGKDWIKGFKKRWSHEVKVRRPTHIKRARSEVSPAVVEAYFNRLRPNLEGVSPSNIFNYNETNVSDDPAAEEAFFGGGCKYYEEAKNTSKIMYSVMFCVSGDGKMLPPYTVFKSPNGALYDVWCEGGPPGGAYGANKSGWFDQDKFNGWFRSLFLRHIRTLPHEEPKVLIGDNLAAHFSPYVIAKCEEHNVRFVFLPENSTQLLQPLDVAVFAPVKRRWRAILNDWKRECMMAGKDIATLPKKELPPPLLTKLLQKDFSSSIISGFEACGLVPFCPQRALMKLPVPADQQ